ncbi:MAG: IMP dehydrogenase [Flavobacterium sp.]|nr:IMP dehydrogenase [Flavobacterium sp.]
MKPISELIKDRKVHTVTKGATVRKVTEYMSEHNIGLVPVLSDEGKLLGVFSERDLVRRVVSKNLDSNNVYVEDVMTTNLVFAGIGESYEECIQKMKSKGTRHILILDNEKLAGIISVRDLLEVDITVKKETIEVLHNYIYSA